ncbi:MAG: membrane-bound lytic murein transglycosylase A [Candidatus Midichloriaceae bacterium]|jgi:membrane-bound lytic murein transglycosylase A
MKVKLFVLLLIAIFLSNCSSVNKRKFKPREVKFVQISYKDIAGWKYDNHLIALKTFSHSCVAILKKQTKSISSLTKVGGSLRNWKNICNELKKGRFKSNEDAKQFFEKWFAPYKILDIKNSPRGKYTGYYEIEINGSLKKTRKCRHPIYRAPKNLLDHQNKSYLSHSSINNGSLKDKKLELLWVDNHARLFFMHIQGSGKIKLNNNKYIRLGYAGQNGFEYKSIGPYFKHYNAKGINSALDMMEWLNRNPRDAKKIIEQNQSYIFFRHIEGEGPIGAQGIHLTPERSIAIDKAIYPYGTPVWIETTLPKTKNYKERKYRRLFIAQDTGGAIKGAIRGDVFFGHGTRAEELACYMNNVGTMYTLFPRSVKIPDYYKTN